MEMINIGELALKILSCVYRAQERYGARVIAETLCGSESKRMTMFEMTKLSTFGIVSNYTTDQVVVVIHYLMHKGLLAREMEHKNLVITREGYDFLKKRPALLIPQKYLAIKREIFATRILPTHEETCRLFAENNSVTEIAQIRGMQESTIEEHLADLVMHGRIEDTSKLVPATVLEQVTRVIEQNPGSRLREIKDELPEEVTYGQIRIAVAMNAAKNRI